MTFAGYDIAVTVVSIMLAAGGIIYGIGHALDDRKIKELGRMELYQSVINGALVGSLVLLFLPGGIITGIMGSTANALAGNTCPAASNYSSAVCFANGYLTGSTFTINNHTYPSLLSSTLTLLAPASLLYVVVGAVSTLNLGIVVISVSPAAGLKFVLGPLQGLIDILSMNILAIAGQSVMLNVISLVAVPLLLPLGLVLRTFYFTRRLGGAILAVAIGFFAVFPMTYLLNAQVLDTYSASAGGQYWTAANTALSTTAANASSLENKAFGLPTYNVTGGGALQYTGFAGEVSAFSSLLPQIMTTIEDAIAFLVIQVFVLPLFGLLLTLVSVRELARILGSEISFGKFDLF